MITIRKSSLKKVGIVGAVVLSLAMLIIVMTPGQISLADGDTCGDGVCSATENSDLCATDCGCVDNGVADPGEGCGCKDVVCDSEPLSSACGTFAGENNECPFKTLSDGTTQSLSEYQGVCWDSCECEGLCTEEDIAAGKSGGGAEVSISCGDKDYDVQDETYCNSAGVGNSPYSDCTLTQTEYEAICSSCSSWQKVNNGDSSYYQCAW